MNCYVKRLTQVWEIRLVKLKSCFKIITRPPSTPLPGTQMEITSCSASGCGRPYQINRFTDLAGAMESHAKIACPHCGTETVTEIEAESNAVFLTHALSEDAEAAFHRSVEQP